MTSSDSPDHQAQPEPDIPTVQPAASAEPGTMGKPGGEAIPGSTAIPIGTAIPAGESGSPGGALLDSSIIAEIVSISAKGIEPSIQKLTDALKAKYQRAASPNRLGPILKAWRARRDAELAAKSAVVSEKTDPIALLRAISPDAAQVILDAADARAKAAADSVVAELQAKIAIEQEAKSLLESTLSDAVGAHDVTKRDLIEAIADRDRLAEINREFDRLAADLAGQISGLSDRMEAQARDHDARDEERRAALDQLHAAIAAQGSAVDREGQAAMARHQALVGTIASIAAEAGASAIQAATRVDSLERAVLALGQQLAAQSLAMTSALSAVARDASAARRSAARAGARRRGR